MTAEHVLVILACLVSAFALHRVLQNAAKDSATAPGASATMSAMALMLVPALAVGLMRFSSQVETGGFSGYGVEPLVIPAPIDTAAQRSYAPFIASIEDFLRNEIASHQATANTRSCTGLRSEILAGYRVDPAEVVDVEPQITELGETAGVRVQRLVFTTRFGPWPALRLRSTTNPRPETERVVMLYLHGTSSWPERAAGLENAPDYHNAAPRYYASKGLDVIVPLLVPGYDPFVAIRPWSDRTPIHRMALDVGRNLDGMELTALLGILRWTRRTAPKSARLIVAGLSKGGWQARLLTILTNERVDGLICVGRNNIADRASFMFEDRRVRNHWAIYEPTYFLNALELTNCRRIWAALLPVPFCIATGDDDNRTDREFIASSEANLDWLRNAYKNASAADNLAVVTYPGAHAENPQAIFDGFIAPHFLGAAR